MFKPLGSALASGTVAEYFNDLKCATETTDATGNNNLTQTGNVPYGNQGQPVGSSASGAFSSSNYFRQSASLGAAMRAATNLWSWQAHIKTPNSGTQILRSMLYGATHFSLLMNGSKFRVDNGVSGFDSVAVAADNTWHHVFVGWNGANTFVYVDGIPDTTSALNMAWPEPAGPENIGIYHDAVNFPFLGYMNQMRYMSSIPSVIPTVDSGGGDNRNLGFIQ